MYVHCTSIVAKIVHIIIPMCIRNENASNEIEINPHARINAKRALHRRVRTQKDTTMYFMNTNEKKTTQHTETNLSIHTLTQRAILLRKGERESWERERERESLIHSARYAYTQTKQYTLTWRIKSICRSIQIASIQQTIQPKERNASKEQKNLTNGYHRIQIR